MNKLTIGIVAGEISGDALGADFMKKMNALNPNVRWVGVGGREMAQAGLTSVIDMSRLSVMGLVEVVKHLPDLLRAKKEILTAFEREKIDIFIGIDAPDFNLRLGKALKSTGVYCVQYVSPSIWAWRENRIHTIKAATDLVLCLFPFELPVYAKHQHPAICVGHPLLDKITPPFDKAVLADALKPYDTLGILGKSNTPKLNAPQICVMAGSRTSEISAILPTLLASLERLSLETPIGDELRDFCAVLPVISREHAKLVAQLVATHTPALAARLQVIYDDGNFTKPYGLNISQTAMAASDITVLASGTATLEAMLLHAPMVVVYKVAPVTYAIAKRLVKVPYVSLPNILANANPAFGSAIVPELLQHAATPKNIASHIAAVRQSEQADNLAKLSELTRNLSAQDPATAVMAHYHKQQSNHT